MAASKQQKDQGLGLPFMDTPLHSPTSSNSAPPPSFHHLPIIPPNYESMDELTHHLGPSPPDPVTPQSPTSECHIGDPSLNT
jgi:hypothetical protein